MQLSHPTYYCITSFNNHNLIIAHVLWLASLLISIEEKTRQTNFRIQFFIHSSSTILSVIYILSNSNIQEGNHWFLIATAVNYSTRSLSLSNIQKYYYHYWSNQLHPWNKISCSASIKKICPLKQENKRAMSKPKSIYMWGNVKKTIKIIESQMDSFNKTTDLYDPQYCSKENEDCSLKSSHIIGELVPMKEPHDFMYGFKSQCTSMN